MVGGGGGGGGGGEEGGDKMRKEGRTKGERKETVFCALNLFGGMERCLLIN